MNIWIQPIKQCILLFVFYLCNLKDKLRIVLQLIFFKVNIIVNMNNMEQLFKNSLELLILKNNLVLWKQQEMNRIKR